jgi:uncharacterized protein (DUF58 family)
VETNPKSLDPQTLAKIKGLQLRAQHIVEGFVAGLHRSPYHGFSIEFAEHREYAPGDDLRYVDWKVFGRTDKYYLKQYEDETNLIVYLVLDVSESMSYRSGDSPLTKLEYAQCLAAAMTWLVLQQQDAIGLVTFDDRIRSYIRPSGNPSHMQTVLHAMDTASATKKTSTGPIFHELAERFTDRGVVMVLSDFFDDVNSVTAGLKHFRYRRHDVVLFHTLDVAELDFPFTQPTLFKGLEEFPEVLADARSLRRAYLKEFNDFLTNLKAGCRGLGMDYQEMRTDQRFDLALVPYLASRMARMK